MENTNDNCFDYFYGNEAEQFSFYRIPKLLFTDDRFSNLSIEAKVLYGLMLDRMSLSVKNGWLDEENKVYIYFKLEDAMSFMNIGKDKGVKLFAELDSEKGCGLIKKKRQGLGKPTMIYVMNFNSFCEVNVKESVEDTEDLQTSEKPNSGLLDSEEVLTSEKPKSELRKNRTLDFVKTEANNTDYNYNNINNTEYNLSYHQSSLSNIENAEVDFHKDFQSRQMYRVVVKKNIEYDCLIAAGYEQGFVDGLVEIMIELICSKKKFIVVNGDQVPQAFVKERMLKLGFEHICYIIDSFKQNTMKIQNIKRYLEASLYNAPVTIDYYYTSEVNCDLNKIKEGIEK